MRFTNNIQTAIDQFNDSADNVLLAHKEFAEETDTRLSKLREPYYMAEGFTAHHRLNNTLDEAVKKLESTARTLKCEIVATERDELRLKPNHHLSDVERMEAVEVRSAFRELSDKEKRSLLDRTIDEQDSKLASMLVNGLPFTVGLKTSEFEDYSSKFIELAFKDELEDVRAAKDLLDQVKSIASKAVESLQCQIEVENELRQTARDRKQEEMLEKLGT